MNYDRWIATQAEERPEGDDIGKLCRALLEHGHAGVNLADRRVRATLRRMFAAYEQDTGQAVRP